MLSKFRSVASAVALGASLFAGTAHAEWLEARTKHFVVVGDINEGDLRKRALRLEQFDAAMRFLFGAEEGVPVRLYLLNSMTDLQRLAGSNSVAGFYSASSQEAHAFMPMKIVNSAPGFTAELVLMHEYTHHMLMANMNTYLPRWANEGLAEMFSTARLNDDGSVTIGAPSVRQWDVKALHRWSVEDLLSKDAKKVSNSEVIERYSRGWALCHYLWMSGKRPGQYIEFIDLLNQSGDQVKAARQAFGDLGKLDSEVDAYVSRSAFPASRLSAKDIKPSTEVTIRRLTAGESAMIVNRMISARGVDARQATELLDQARPIAARYPSDASVQGWFAEMAFDAGRVDEADQAADRALAADPKSLAAMVFKGRVVARKALDTKDPADWKLARSWFLRANRIDPNDAYPFQLFYDSFGAAGQRPSESAITGLYRAVVLMPQDSALRVRASMELLREGDMARARAVLAPVAFTPEGTGVNPAMQMIEAMDAGTGKDGLLAKAGELHLANINSLIPPKEGGADKDNTGDTN